MRVPPSHHGWTARPPHSPPPDAGHHALEERRPTRRDRLPSHSHWHARPCPAAMVDFIHPRFDRHELARAGARRGEDDRPHRGPGTPIAADAPDSAGAAASTTRRCATGCPDGGHRGGDVSSPARAGAGRFSPRSPTTSPATTGRELEPAATRPPSPPSSGLAPGDRAELPGGRCARFASPVRRRQLAIAWWRAAVTRRAFGTCPGGEPTARAMILPGALLPAHSSPPVAAGAAAEVSPAWRGGARRFSVAGAEAEP
jgi:hypothetical protein